MYSPYQFNPYPQYPPQQNTLPPQQVLQANGKASIDAIRMAPNSSVLVMDATAPMVWLCTSDSLGNVTPTPYDITPHREAPKENDFEKRLAAVEAQLMEVINAKSNAGNVKPEHADRADGAD